MRELVKNLLDSGKSQTEVAREAKVSQATIHKILYTDTNHSVDLLRKFSHTYGVPLEDLIAEKQDVYHASKIPVTLTEEENRLISLFKRLDPSRRQRLVETAEDMVGALAGSLGRGGRESDSKDSRSA